MQIFRKHSKAILWAMVLLIGLPMLFFGLPTCQTNPSDQPDPIVASVGNLPVPASQYRRFLDLAARRAARGGERPTYEEMVETGMAQNVLDEALDSARLSLLEQERGFNVDVEYLQEQLKKESIFQDDEGNFNPKAWNEWVRAQKTAGTDFNLIYNDILSQVSRGVLLNTVMAPGNRVFDEDLDRELEENYTKLKVRWTKVGTQVAVSDEEVRAQYDENPDRYKYPDKHVAEFVRIDMTAPPTQETLDLVAQLRGGADFAALADEHSDLEAKNGGDMGWQFPRENEAAYRKPLFELAVGAVSEPIAGPQGYYIYTVEEERTNEESGAREVKSRQIYVKTALSAEERQAKQALADSLVVKANAALGLAAAAEEAGLAVTRTGQFDQESTEISPIDAADVMAFGGSFRTLDEAAPYKKVSTTGSLYVAGVVETEEGTVKPFEEVAEQAREDAVAAYRRTDAYREQVAALAEEIAASGKKVEEMAEAFPAFEGEVKETQPFTKKDYLYQEGLFVATPDIFDAFREEEPGAVAGPLSGFVGDSYFVELVERTPPAEEDKQNWPQEREQLRAQALQVARMEVMQDYLLDLRNSSDFPATYNNEVISQILGTGENAEPEEAPETGAADDAEAGGIPAPAEEAEPATAE